MIEYRKIAIVKYIESLNIILNLYEDSHKLITTLKAFKPIGKVHIVNPSVLSAMMAFGMAQNKNLEDIEKLLNKILLKFVPYARKYHPEFDLTDLFTLVNKIYVFKKKLNNACAEQYDVCDFNYSTMTDRDIFLIFSNMGKLIKNYEEIQFKLMAIDSDYKNFFEYTPKTICEKFTKNEMKEIYLESFLICSFLSDVSTIGYLSDISYFVDQKESYKKMYSGDLAIVEIPK